MVGLSSCKPCCCRDQVDCHKEQAVEADHDDGDNDDDRDDKDDGDKEYGNNDDDKIVITMESNNIKADCHKK